MRTPLRHAALATLALLLSACQPVASALGAAGIQCAPRSAGATALSAEWQPFARYIDECTVTDGKGSNGAAKGPTIVAVSAQRFYAEQKSGATTVDMPRPILYSGDRDVGRLPYNYPDDPPFALELTFSEWRSGWPWRIDLFVRDPTVTGDHALDPMRWDEATRTYSRTREK